MLKRDLIIHPSETLMDVLREKKITINELAKKMQISKVSLEKHIESKKRFDIEFSLKLESVFGLSAEFWTELQNIYDAEITEYNLQKLKKNSN